MENNAKASFNYYLQKVPKRIPRKTKKKIKRKLFGFEKRRLSTLECFISISDISFQVFDWSEKGIVKITS